MSENTQIVPVGSFDDMFASGRTEELLETAKPFIELMMQYECAVREVETKLNVLNDEFSTLYNYNPIETIKTRVKDPRSIIEKMKRKGLKPSIENREKNLNKNSYE